MQITLNFTDEEAALLEKGLALDNFIGLKISTVSGYSLPELSLSEYIYATLIAAVAKEVNDRERALQSEEATQ